MHTYVKRDYQASQIFVKNWFPSNYSKVLNICQSVCAGAGGGPDSGASQASFSLWMISLGRQLWLMSDEGAVDTTRVVAPGGGTAMVGCSQGDPTNMAQKLLSSRFFSRQTNILFEVHN